MLMEGESGTVAITPIDIHAQAARGFQESPGVVRFRGSHRATDTKVLIGDGTLETVDVLKNSSAPHSFSWRVAIRGAVQQIVPASDGGFDIVRVADAPKPRRLERSRARSAGHRTRRSAPRIGTRAATTSADLPLPPNARVPRRPAPPHAVRLCSDGTTGGPLPGLIGAASALRTGCTQQPSWAPGIPVSVTTDEPSDTAPAPRSQPHRTIGDGDGQASATVVAHIEPPVSVDAAGRDVPTSLSVSGDTVTMHVKPGTDAKYPIEADPVIVGQDDTRPCSSVVQSGTLEGRGVLVRSCRIWFAVGFNDYRLMNYAAGLPHPFRNSTTINQGCGPIMSSEDQDYELQRIAETGSNVVRVWFFQKYFQDFRDDPASGGHDPWQPYIHLLQTAKRHGLLVIPVLTNDWNQCDREPSSGDSAPANNKQHADYTFFGSGPGGATPTYKVPGTFGYTYSARQWANMVAQKFGPSGSYSDLTSTIAFYQLVNEAEVDISPSDASTCGPDGANSLYSFGNDMGAVVKAAYAGHTEPLISLGTMGIGQCGVSSHVPDPVGHPSLSDFTRIHQAPNVDLCEIHDYDAQSISDPTFDWYALPYNDLAQRIKECGSKPIFVGEAGVEANVQEGDIGRRNHAPSPPAITPTTLRRRAKYFSDKIASSLNAGVAGYVLWDKIMAGSDSEWNAANDEGLGFGAYGYRTNSVRHQDPTHCVLQDLASQWMLGDSPPSVASEATCDTQVPLAGPAIHYAFVDGTDEGWSNQYTWGDLTTSVVTGNAPSGHPATDPTKHALRITIGSNMSPAIEVESDSVGLLQPGDTVSMWIYRPTATPNIHFSPMLRLGSGWTACPGKPVRVAADGKWHKLTMKVPSSTSGLGCLSGTPSNLGVHAVGLYVQDDNPWGAGAGKSFLLNDVSW